MKELETVLADEPGLLGPKARGRNIGRGMMTSDKRLCSYMAFMRFCLSEAKCDSFVCIYADSLEPS